MQRPRWGILATGWVAGEFAKDLTAHGHALRAVGSRTAQAATAFAVTHAIPLSHAHDSYEGLVHDDDIDIVYVASPNPFHLEHALLALRAGKHVLVEKPFSLDAAEARMIHQCAQSAGRVAMEAMWVRFLPHMAYVRSVIATGVLGRLRGLIADHTRDLPRDPLHRINSAELGGGALLDLGIYPISLAHHIFGTSARTAADGAIQETGVDEQVSVVMRHADSVLSTLMATTQAQGPNKAVILGSEGRLEISPAWDPARVTLFDRDGRMLSSRHFPVSGRGMQYQAAEFERTVIAGLAESPLMTVADSVDIMTILDDVRSQIGVEFPRSERPFA